MSTVPPPSTIRPSSPGQPSSSDDIEAGETKSGIKMGVHAASTEVSHAETVPVVTRRPGSVVLQVLGVWIWEILFCVISMASFISTCILFYICRVQCLANLPPAIVAVLGAYDNNALPNLPLHISLNTLVAFLSTLAKAALMIPIAESISQWKWNWFRHDRSLADFQTFDLASRGLWGAVSLLGKTRWRNIATVGAAVTIIGIITSPITQQTVSYPERRADAHGIAATSAARHIANPSIQPYPDYLRMVNSIHVGFEPNGDNYTHLTPDCSTGDCTFDPFPTLGLCAKVRNATHLLTATAMPHAYYSDFPTWGDELAINTSMVAYNVTAPMIGAWIVTPCPYTMNLLTLNDSFLFLDDPNLRFTTLYDGFIIYANGPNMSYPNFDVTKQPSFQAVEMILHLCVRTLEIKVVEGKPTTISREEPPRILSPLPESPVFQHRCTEWTTSGKVSPYDCGFSPSRVPPYDLVLDGPGGNFSAHSRLLSEITVNMHLGLTSFWDWNGKRLSSEIGAEVGMKLVNAVWGSTDGLEAQFSRIQEVAQGVAIGGTSL